MAGLTAAWEVTPIAETFVVVTQISTGLELFDGEPLYVIGGYEGGIAFRSCGGYVVQFGDVAHECLCRFATPEEVVLWGRDSAEYWARFLARLNTLDELLADVEVVF